MEPFEQSAAPAIQQAATRILDIIEATYQSTHRYVSANPSDYRHLDIKWYDATAQLLVRNGFRSLADVEDKTITESPGTVLSAIMLRCMVSRDGSVTAALYHPHLKPFWLRAMLWLTGKLPKHVTDFETELTDGSFVATSNAAAAASIAMPPMLRAEYLKAGTPPLEVLQRHRQRVSEVLAANPGVTARVVRTHADLLAAQHRQNALKAAYRGEVGGITREELDKLSSRWTQHVVPAVHDEIERQQARRAG